MKPRALLLAAGLSTRLGSLSSERPKPLMPVCDVPLLRYALALLRHHGITEVAINLHHLGDQIEDELGDGSDAGVAITYSRETEILGTGGGIKQLAAFLTRGGRESFFVINGKILIDVDLDAVWNLHTTSDAVATMVVREVPDAAKWGAIDTDGDRVVGIIGKGARGTMQSMFTGVHVLSPPFVARLPNGVSDSIRDAYIPLLADGAPIRASHVTGYFHEHSTPQRYLEGNINALRGRATITYAPAPFVGVDPTAQIAASATISPISRIGAAAIIGEDVLIGDDVVVGHDAVIAAGTRLTRTVVWPGAYVSGELANTIITPHRHVSANEDDKVT